MGTNNKINMIQLPNDPKIATKCITVFFFDVTMPLMRSIRKKLQDNEAKEDDIIKLRDVFALCTSQIKKCLLTIFDLLKIEYREHVLLQETRQCILQRFLWCVRRISCIEDYLENPSQRHDDSLNDSMLLTPMYFVNWIDHTFEILSKLAEVIYNTDYKDSEDLYKQWKNDVVECVSTLHLSLDELLLSAMTLCKYCLPTDQHIVKARCQVVLRESKALLSELLIGDVDSGIKLTAESLKLPIKPSNINVLIDVLKDVLYVLETNTNTALLTLVVHCFSNSVSPVDVLKQHFLETNGSCSCHVKSNADVTEDCTFVQEFDLYNERLVQIGSFAVSCSSDQARIISVRSGLASLEALEPQLVPALQLAAASLHAERHAELLARGWRQEVQEIRDGIFLIVDPAAFAEKAKQMMHQLLLDLTKETAYSNSGVCSVVNIGDVVRQFFAVYNKHEPDALTQHGKLVPLLDDLDKVLTECKLVSNLLCSESDFVFDVKKTNNNKKVTLEQLLKRLKLLYTLIGKINSLFHPVENDDFYEEEEKAPLKNVTHSVRKNILTYVQSPRKPTNISRSIFARTTTLRTSTNKFPLQILTKHLKAKQRDELSFSVQLDEMFNLSEVKGTEKLVSNKQLESVREPSILYNFSPKKRSSLRKAVLNRHCKLPFESELKKPDDKVEISVRSDTLVDEATSLQITDILNEMNDMTTAFSKLRISPKVTHTEIKHDRTYNQNNNANVLSISINADNAVAKKIWTIPVNASMVDVTLDDSAGAASNMTGVSNITAPSNVTTLERINDLEYLETKLNNLKSLDLETSL